MTQLPGAYILIYHYSQLYVTVYRSTCRGFAFDFSAMLFRRMNYVHFPQVTLLSKAKEIIISASPSIHSYAEFAADRRHFC